MKTNLLSEHLQTYSILRSKLSQHWIMMVKSLSIQKIQIRWEEITLGNFAEGQGNHYVCLQREIAEDEETQQQDLDDIADNTVENNTEETVPIRDEAKEVASLEALPIKIILKKFPLLFDNFKL